MGIRGQARGTPGAVSPGVRLRSLQIRSAAELSNGSLPYCERAQIRIPQIRKRKTFAGIDGHKVMERSRIVVNDRRPESMTKSPIRFGTMAVAADFAF